MADGFIVRKGGVAEEVLRTTAPSINFVSKTTEDIVVTFTNNDAAEAEIYYGITSTLTDTVTLAAAATSSNITFSGLDDDTAFIVSAYALVTDPTSKKIKSEIATTVITTDVAPVFTAATGGTTLEYDSGGKRFKSHTFLENGNFVVSTVGDNEDDRNKVDYLIIAGGGGGGAGGNSIPAGGGGAGGYRTTNATSGGPSPTTENKATITATSFSVTIGAGGSGGVSRTTGSSGTSTSVSFPTTISTTGGGGGATLNSTAAGNGGSGGGGSSLNITTAGTGTSNEGFSGGNGRVGEGGNRTSGGGGGAGQLGVAAISMVSGNGGNGLANILRDGNSETRAGGGGGGSLGSGTTGGSGGSGGGGDGAENNTTVTSGTANTGSGGGGNSFDSDGGNGGSGIVVIRYEIAPSV